MSTYDLKRLEVAIQYIRRMSDGKNPVTNRPAPENEVLNNMNVHRCLKFIDEVLTDVHKSGGTVGMVSQRTSKQSVSEIFPYETLTQYRYLQDQQISYFLKQLEEYLPEGQKIPVPATTITLWMRGLYSEKAGTYPNEYYRVFYNEKAQRFIIDNFRRILTESEEIRDRNRREKKKDGSPRSARQSAGNVTQENAPNKQSVDNSSPHGFESSEPAPVEDLPQEYYDMLRDGWETSDNGVPW